MISTLSLSVSSFASFASSSSSSSSSSCQTLTLPLGCDDVDNSQQQDYVSSSSPFDTTRTSHCSLSAMSPIHCCHENNNNNNTTTTTTNNNDRLIITTTTTTTKSTNTNTKSTKTKRHVRFHPYIEIREHPRTLGDHPSVSCGPPISLDWYNPKKNSNDIDNGTFDNNNGCCSKTISIPFNEYERKRSKKRQLYNFYLPIGLRTKLLLEDAGVSITEIRNAEIEVNNIKAKRLGTVLWIQYELLFLFVEEIVRLLYRLFVLLDGDHGGSRSGYNNNNANNNKSKKYCSDYEVQMLLKQCEQASTSTSPTTSPGNRKK